MIVAPVRDRDRAACAPFSTATSEPAPEPRARLLDTAREVPAPEGIEIALYPAGLLAADAQLPAAPPPQSFRGVTLAWNCASEEAVDAVLDRAWEAGGRLIKPAGRAQWGGYHGYFADPDDHAWEVAHNPFFPLAADGRLLLPE